MSEKENTRRERAVKLMERLDRGPAFTDTHTLRFTKLEAIKQYRAWASKWVLKELVDLVPELRKMSRVHM